MSFHELVVLPTRLSKKVRSLLALTLTLALAITGVIVAPSASAVPGKGVISGITSSASSTGPTDVTVTFTRPDSVTLTGILYSTNNGNSWAQCDSTFCTWATVTSTSFVLKKLSSASARLQYDDTYQIIFILCQGGSPSNANSTTSSYAGLPLNNCGPQSDPVSYAGATGIQSAPAPAISTPTSIANGATNFSVTITSNDFKTGIATSDFTITPGTTGLTAGTLTRTDSTTVAIAFAGPAKYGDISFQAKTSAYTTAPSAASNTVTISVPNTTPPAPGTPTGVVANSAQINLTWAAPTNNLGSAVTDYLVYYSSDSGNTWDTFTATASTSLTRNITGLNASTAYIFKVAAKNLAGYGPFSSNSSAYTTTSGPTVPETPTSVSAGSATTTSLQVSYTAPGNNGGSSITGYVVQYSLDNGTTWDTATANTSSNPYTVSGLTINTSYIFRVAAKNAQGTGPFSVPSSAASTSANTPPAPEPERTYAPTISSLSKLKVCARGQDEFVIRGAGFKDATVTIDGIVVDIKGKSDGVLNLKFGEGTEGKKLIKITNSAGTATAEIEFKLVDRTAFKVFDIPYIYKGGTFTYFFEAFGENTFRITGNMPGGLVLNEATGEISGIPTESGVFNFVLHADGVCGNDVDVIRLDVDKEIPNAISYRIKFKNKKSNKITGSAELELKKFLEHIKEISPKQIEPIVYISGGAPEDEAEVDSPEAKERRDALCDVMLTNDILAQTIPGLFDGEEDEIEIFVYWPVVR